MGKTEDTKLDYQTIYTLFDNLPYQIIVVNSQKEVVFGNNTFAQLYDIQNLNDVLGLKPGEILHCENSSIGPDGCGSSHECNFCGINHTFFKAKLSNRREKGNGQLTYIQNKKKKLLQYEITVVPIEFEGKQFYLFTLLDISKSKESETFQRLFFHDLLNISGSLQGLFSLMIKRPEYLQKTEVINLAYEMCLQLSDEILKQKEILFAEKGELIISKESIQLQELILHCIHSIKQNKVAKGKKIQFLDTAQNVSIKTDETLLRRIILNLIKNALEAEKTNETITIGVKKSNSVIIWVHNNTEIVEEIKDYIFKKSYSTKGKGRGLGTYSIKLFAEEFLGADVSFESTKKDGTTFYISFPLSQVDK